MRNKKTCTRQKLCFKKLLSLLLSLILLLQSFPMGTMAAEEYSGRTKNSFLSSESVREEMEVNTGDGVSEKIEIINEGKQVPLMAGSPTDPDQYAVQTTYTYENDLVKTLESPGETLYNLEYTGFGLLCSIGVGNRILTDYT